MKVKTLIPFIVILLILGGIVAWQKMNVQPVAPIATQIGLESLVPEGLGKDSIVRIELFAGEAPDEKVTLEREGDAWRITSLHNAPANKETVEDFLDKMLGLKGEPRATADSDARLADFSLADAEAFHVRGFRKDADTPEVDVLFGKSADFRTVFLRKAGANRVFVEATNLRREAGVSDSGEGALPKPTKWLQTVLLTQEEAAINRIALKYPDKELVLTRETVEVETEPLDADEDEETPPAPVEPEVTYKWTLSEGGFSADIKEQEVKSLLKRFANLTVTNVADPERKADWGFEPAQFSITIGREGQDDVVLLGGRDKPGGDTYIQLVGSEPELIYQISKFNFEQIFLQGSKLFTLPEWTVAKESLQSIAVSGPDTRIAMALEGDSWQLTEPNLKLETQKTAVDNLVTAMTSLKPSDYADAGADVGAFDTTITAVLADGGSRVLHVGQPSKHLEGRYVKFDDNPAVLVLSRTDVEKLMPPVRDLFVLSVLDFDMEQVKQVHLAGEKDDLALALDEDANQWSGTFNGAAIQPDPMMVEDLVFSLNEFQVDNFLLDRAVDAVQAASTIKVALKDGTETVIRLSAESGGQYEMTVSGIPYVFSVSVLHLAGIIDEVARFADLVQEVPEPEPAPEEDVPAQEETVDVPAADSEQDAAPAVDVPVEEALSEMSVVIPDQSAESADPQEAGAQPVELTIE